MCDTEEEKLAVTNSDYGNIKEEEKGSENSKISLTQSSSEKKTEKSDKIEKIEKESSEDIRKKKLKDIVDQIPTKK